MSCRTVVDLSKLEKRFSDSARRGKQAAFAKRVAFEIGDYVPEELGALKGSEPLSSDYENGIIEWNTPYAQHVHDLPQSSIKKAKNPNARSHWPAAAKAERAGAWEDFARKLMEEK